MIELTYGLVVGIGLAAVLLLLWNLWGAISGTASPSPISIDTTALVVLGLLGCLGYWFQSSYPQFAVGTTGWGQRLFGVLAGLAFWVWVKYAVSDVLVHRRATQQIPTPSSQWETSTKKSAAITARWWESEPWRAITSFS